VTGARPTLVILGGGPAQQHAIDAAHALGVRTVVCDSEPGLGDATVSSEDAAGVLRVAAEAAADGLIAPGTDWPVCVAAEVAAKLGLPHPLTPAVARAATDKIAQRKAFMAAGVPQPDWSTEQPPGYPCVVKAADRQGQRAMTVVHSPDGLAVAVERARAGSRSGRAILERFAEGREVTVNGFCCGGTHHIAGITDREHFPAAYGVARRHIYPAADPDGAAAAATAAVAALGIAAGPTYVQVVVTRHGPQVMEVAARLGGGHDSELIRLTTGVDLARSAVEAALGWPVAEAALQPHPKAAGAIEFLQAPVGTLALTDGPPGIRFYHAPGHVYGELAIATDRAGYVLCAAPTREEALQSVRRLVAKVRIDTR
jgi:S-sulfo-L-cysteine synthase (3-phospho-L-serine-dependent)